MPDPIALEHKGAAQDSTLDANLGGSTGDVTIVLDPAPDYADWPDGSTGAFWIDIDFEENTAESILCEARADNVLTVFDDGLTNGRGGSDTTVTAHSAGAVVRHVFVSEEAQQFNDHMLDTTSHGATGAVVGTTNTQTLTNKTLTAPVIADFTNAAHDHGDANDGGGLVSPSLTGPLEVCTVAATAATGTINFDCITQAVLYYTTNASANWTLNVRGSAGVSLNTLLAVGQSVTITFLVTQGGTAYYQSALTVDGGAVTPKWQGGTAPSAGNASSIDAYTITIIKTADATFTAFAAQTKFA